MEFPELLDIVNNSDKVIGTTFKEEAHQRGYVHRVVVVYVFGRDGELIVQRVGKNKLYDHSVGGHVVKGESYDIAVHREAHEELNLQGHMKFIGRLYSDESTRNDKFRHMYAIYQSHTPDRWIFVPNKEVKTIESMSLFKILELMKSTPSKFTPGFLATMEYYLAAIHPQLFST